MTFTDEDLKRLKETMDSPDWHSSIGSPELEALIARLEAAEKVIVQSTRLPRAFDLEHDGYEFHHDWHEALEAWRKAAGR